MRLKHFHMTGKINSVNIRYVVYGMIIGMFSNQKLQFYIAEHFMVKIDNSSLHFLVASFQSDDTFNYDILHVCSFQILNDCATNDTTIG